MGDEGYANECTHILVYEYSVCATQMTLEDFKGTSTREILSSSLTWPFWLNAPSCTCFSLPFSESLKIYIMTAVSYLPCWCWCLPFDSVSSTHRFNSSCCIGDITGFSLSLLLGRERDSTICKFLPGLFICVRFPLDFKHLSFSNISMSTSQTFSEKKNC